MVRRIPDPNQYCTSTVMVPGSRAGSARRQREKQGVDGAGGTWRRGRPRQAIATRVVALGTASAWRCELSRQVMVTDLVNLEVLGAWRYVSPARRSGSCGA
ncbi:hypothetical protein DEO72_LG9g1637 [Vigna unguiculata]|uniref:Uncharacterized protein n=1 Tax=Vigna unguiculata TaxID=3917 RepID=A0A4D6MYQ3_VIGUN|nr:hypothetical protein DEO72_LG9g1637 [Vigna unguiculata]